MQNITHTIITIAGFILAGIILYDLVEHGDAVVNILKASSNFVTTETTALEAK